MICELWVEPCAAINDSGIPEIVATAMTQTRRKAQDGGRRIGKDSPAMQGTSMNQLDRFEISIRRKDDKIIAAVPQLGLYATASDIHGALDALERKKSALLKDLIAAGEVEHLSAVAVADPVAPATSQGLAQFALKVGIVVVLVAAAIVITSNLVATKFESARLAWQATLQDYTKIGGAQFWSKVEKGLDQLADPRSEMPEEKRQKILSNIRVLRDRWWPFIAEAMPADAKSK